MKIDVEMVGRFTDEKWSRAMVANVACIRNNRSDHLAGMLDRPLLRHVGWVTRHIMMKDLQPGEGAIFRPGGLASYSPDKHQLWVCVAFKDLLKWLYKRDRTISSPAPEGRTRHRECPVGPPPARLRQSRHPRSLAGRSGRARRASH